MISVNVNNAIAVRTEMLPKEQRSPDAPSEHDSEQIPVGAALAAFGRSRQIPLTGTRSRGEVEMGFAAQIGPLPEFRCSAAVNRARKNLLVECLGDTVGILLDSPTLLLKSATAWLRGELGMAASQTWCGSS